MTAATGLDLQGAGVVITGGAGGIGAAMAHRLAVEGARIMIADLDGDAVEEVADRSPNITAVALDASSEAGIRRLIEAAVDELGAIDVYCANAGVAPPGSPAYTEASWARAWEVNVMAHVRAAEQLLPSWLDRGRGRFVATVSAAGMLTMLGAAPYAVTKHGALAFAEWLAASYRHRGITVQALCPQGVHTRMLAESAVGVRALVEPTAISPEHVAETVVEALADDRFFILPHPELAGYYRAKAQDPDRWIAGMNILQRKIEIM